MNKPTDFEEKIAEIIQNLLVHEIAQLDAEEQVSSAFSELVEECTAKMYPDNDCCEDIVTEIRQRFKEALDPASEKDAELTRE